MATKDPNILRGSSDPQALLDTAVAYAESDQAADQAVLAGSLQSADFLKRLDDPATTAGPARRMRVARVMKTLMDNPSAAAKPTLVGLIHSPSFVAVSAREELLIQALAVVRPAPPEVIAYWDKHSQAESVYRHYAVAAMCDNGSEPAIVLLEKKMADPKHDPEEKVAWMHNPILRHRNDLPLLRGCNRMLTQSMPPDLRPALVESLFDYRRDDWYRVCTPPVPPERLAAPRPSREELRTIAQLSLDTIPLDPRAEAQVKLALKELEQSLK